MIRILEARPDDPHLLNLVKVHRQFCGMHTPAGSGHAVSGEEAGFLSIRYWLGIHGEACVGCIGLKPIDGQHAEIKTMHVLPSVRANGIGSALVRHVVSQAAKAGFTRLSLETGGSDAFAPSRRLYAREGFAPCEPFGHYVGDPFSYCMSRML